MIVQDPTTEMIEFVMMYFSYLLLTITIYGHGIAFGSFVNLLGACFVMKQLPQRRPPWSIIAILILSQPIFLINFIIFSMTTNAFEAIFAGLTLVVVLLGMF